MWKINGYEIQANPIGPLNTNCYFIKQDRTGEMLIVDPAFFPDKLEKLLEAAGCSPVAILLTHGHFDHIGAVEGLRARYGIPVYAFAGEQELLLKPELNQSTMLRLGFSLQADILLQDRQKIELAGMEIEVLHTPGHTPGSVSYYMEAIGMLFCGDTLFLESVGRTDFPGGDAQALAASIRERLYCLPDETIVLPGHGEATTIAHEKAHNPYVEAFH